MVFYLIIILPKITNQHIHGGDRLAVVVEAHIEGLDLTGIVGDEYRLVEDLLGEVALMLGLQVDAPGNGLCVVDASVSVELVTAEYEDLEVVDLLLVLLGYCSGLGCVSADTYGKLAWYE